MKLQTGKNTYQLLFNPIIDSSYSNEIRAAFTDDGSSDVSRSVLTPKQTVDRLLSILHKNEFESGTRIDYFDD